MRRNAVNESNKADLNCAADASAHRLQRKGGAKEGARRIREREGEDQQEETDMAGESCKANNNTMRVTARVSPLSDPASATPCARGWEWHPSFGGDVRSLDAVEAFVALASARGHRAVVLLVGPLAARLLKPLAHTTPPQRMRLTCAVRALREAILPCITGVHAVDAARDF